MLHTHKEKTIDTEETDIYIFTSMMILQRTNSQSIALLLTSRCIIFLNNNLFFSYTKSLINHLLTYKIKPKNFTYTSENLILNILFIMKLIQLL